jgi:hypothetical protein
MRKAVRRESAKAWLASGAQVTVKSYAKRYGVDMVVDAVQVVQRNLRVVSRVIGAGRLDQWEIEPEVIREAGRPVAENRGSGVSLMIDRGASAQTLPPPPRLPAAPTAATARSADDRDLHWTKFGEFYILNVARLAHPGSSSMVRRSHSLRTA